MNDVRDILALGGGGRTNSTGTGSQPKSSKPRKNPPLRRPEGMKREVFALLSTDDGKNNVCMNIDTLAPLLPTDTASGYKPKTKIGSNHVRPWAWTPFTNPARKDGAVFYHWQRTTDEQKEYPFAKLNKQVEVPTYTEVEYEDFLDIRGWTKAQTDHLFDLCQRFDLRFPIIQDRWNKEEFGPKTIEDLKERYYEVCGVLKKIRTDPTLPDPHVPIFDAAQERMRKAQLDRLWNRSPEEVEEEAFLRAELEKIEATKRDRERKRRELQKLINAVDSTHFPSTYSAKKQIKEEKNPSQIKKISPPGYKKKFPAEKKKDIIASTSTAEVSSPELEPGSMSAIKWPKLKLVGASIRSQSMKLPYTLSKKKVTGMESILCELGIELNQHASGEIANLYNELRSDVALLYDLRRDYANFQDFVPTSIEELDYNSKY